MTDFRITLTGVMPLIMNNSRLAYQLDPAAREYKALSGKRNKTDADLEDLFRVGHAGALYHDFDIGPYLPSDNIWKALYEGALKHRLGPKIEQGVLITTDVNPVGYDGPRDVAGLWADERFRFIHMRVTGSGRSRKRVPFCRPIFRAWKVEADGVADDGIIDMRELVTIAETAGARVGIGDWRPRYGRFTAGIEQR